MSPCLATASVWTSTSPRHGARSGARTLVADETGFLTLVRHVRVRHGESVLWRTFAVFPKGWKKSRLSLPSSMPASTLWSNHDESGLNFFRRLLGTRNFSGQISQVLRRRRFPDLILISI